MPTGNFDVSPTPESSSAGRILPADYYARPIDQGARVAPQWVVFGCGGVAALVLLTMFLASMFVSKAGLGQMFDFTLSMAQAEAVRMYSADVSKEARAAYEAEVSAVRKELVDGKLSPARLDPLLQELQKATADKLVKPDEVQRLTAAARKVRASRVKP